MQHRTVELSRVELEGCSIAYRSAGAGDPLVLLHGFLCDSRVWEPQLSDLSDDFTVIAWDAPGAGLSSTRRCRSASPTGQFGSWSSSTPVESTALTLSGSPGAAFWHRSSTASTRRGSQGWCWRTPMPGGEARWGREVAAQRLARCERESTLDVEAFVRLWVSHEFFTGGVSNDTREQMAVIVHDFHPLGFRLMARSLAETDTTELLPTITVPVLLVWGEGDLRSPLSVATQFRDAIPGAELAVLAGAGHVSNLQQPKRIHGSDPSILLWLSRRLIGPRGRPSHHARTREQPMRSRRGGGSMVR
jgi:pimeloyl-ACP methyl ester carboxylesterase